MDDGSILGSKEALIVFLTALTKRSGGELVISEDELESVSKEDSVSLYYNKQSRQIILTTRTVKLPSKMDIN